MAWGQEKGADFHISALRACQYEIFDFVPCSLPLKTLILLTFSCFLIRRRGRRAFFARFARYFRPILPSGKEDGQACRSRPRKIPYKSQGVYLTFIPLPRDTYPRAPSLAPSGQFTLCPEPPLPCRGEGGIPFGFAGTEGDTRGGQRPPLEKRQRSITGNSVVSSSSRLFR